MQQLLGWFSAFLAEARLLSGRPAEARELAREALAVTEEVRFRYGSGMAQRALGRIARAAGDRRTRRRDGFARPWRASAPSQAPFEVARTRLDLALLAGGGSEEAASQLGEARRLFAELRLPRYVERGRAFGRRAGARRGAENERPTSDRPSPPGARPGGRPP